MGPDASVWMRSSLGAGGLAGLHEWIRSISSGSETGPRGACDFWLSSGTPLGEPFDGEPRRFSWEPCIPELSDGEGFQVAQAFGWVPAFEVALCAFSSDAIDHRLLGRLALAIAEQQGGLVHFGGVLACSNGSRSPGGPARPRIDEVRSAIGRLPGKVAEVWYETVTGEWFYHVADAPFLRAWLASPGFHMVR